MSNVRELPKWKVFALVKSADISVSSEANCELHRRQFVWGTLVAWTALAISILSLLFSSGILPRFSQQEHGEQQGGGYSPPAARSSKPTP